MAKTFVRIEVPDSEDITADPEIVLIDLDRISHCEISPDPDDDSEWYSVFDVAGKEVVAFEVNMMRKVADAIERTAAEAQRVEWLRDTEN